MPEIAVTVGLRRNDAVCIQQQMKEQHLCVDVLVPFPVQNLPVEGNKPACFIHRHTPNLYRI